MKSGQWVIIQLSHGKVAICDQEDLERLNQHHWYAHFNLRSRLWYAETKYHKRIIGMHRVIMRDPPGFLVDHRNGRTLDNRKENLRICDKSQNQQNQFARRGGSSPFKGVSYHKRDRCWYAYIQVYGKSLHLGRFEIQEGAAKAYDDAAKEHFGQFANLNFPERKTA